MDDEVTEPRNRPIEADSSEGESNPPVAPPTSAEIRQEAEPTVRGPGSPIDDEDREWAQFIRSELIKKHGTAAEGRQLLTAGEASDSKTSFAAASASVVSELSAEAGSGNAKMKMAKEESKPGRQEDQAASDTAKSPKIRKKLLERAGSRENEPRKFERKAAEESKPFPAVEKWQAVPMQPRAAAPVAASQAAAAAPRLPEQPPAVSPSASVPTAVAAASAATATGFADFSHTAAAVVPSAPPNPAAAESSAPPEPSTQASTPSAAAASRTGRRRSGLRRPRKSARTGGQRARTKQRSGTASQVRPKAATRKNANRIPRAARKVAVRSGMKSVARKKRAR